MFKNKYSNFLTVLLIIAIIVIIIIAIIGGMKIYKSYKTEEASQQAIRDFMDNPNLNTNTNTSNTVDENDVYINSTIPGYNGIENNNNNNTTVTQQPKKVKFYEEFVMIGYIEIPKTDIEYPILAETTAEALETSVGVLYPTNPTLNTEGNVVIIGHNYRNGKFFSNNKKLTVGDKINITDESGKKMTYTIYEIFETTPEDTAYMTRDTAGNIEISLSTCTDDGSKRLVILAKV